MKFGKLPQNEIDLIDFSLPEDCSDNFNNSISDLEIYIGAPAWGIKHWVGKVYPEKTNQKNFLFEYARQFNSIELNSYHYRLPTVENIETWVSKVPKDFKFCPKVTAKISHYNGMVNQSAVEEFIEVTKTFGQNLGTVFMQLNQNFKKDRLGNLKKFIELWRGELPLHIEFRHESWFVDRSMFNFLSDQNIGVVVTDVAGRRDLVHSTLTTNEVIIRFVGNELHETDFLRLDDWVDRITLWNEKGLKTVYFFVHQPDEITAPETTNYFINKVNKRLGTKIPEIALKNREQLELI